VSRNNTEKIGALGNTSGCNKIEFSSHYYNQDAANQRCPGSMEKDPDSASAGDFPMICSPQR
jgi:hypothetical protein